MKLPSDRPFCGVFLAFGLIVGQNAAMAQPAMPAEPAVAAANRALASKLSLDDRRDFEDANRGFIATAPDSSNPDSYKFLRGDAPPTVNPSLWRQAKLDAITGLFKVADGVYQIRGFSISNMTIVEGATGLIVIDPLLNVGSARDALDLYFAHRPRKPVLAVIYTHSHSDHYAGVKGVTTEADVQTGKTKIIAPAGFIRESVSESVTAGNPMLRRAQYQFGIPLPRNERGSVGTGLGIWAFRGSPERSLFAPSDSIEQPIENRIIDGVPIMFQLALATEAPSEMNLYFPNSHVLDVPENAIHTLHNLLPLRGSQVRDAKAWSASINDAIERFGTDAQVMIGQHNWPVWGNDRILERLRNQRDLYKYVHDQSVRMMGQGFRPGEIAEALTPPPGLENDWSTRGYYGTLSHNAKAVYQRYLGWYDGNPANLNPITPVEAAKKSIEYMGGAPAVTERARADFKAGNYRWVAQVMSQVVFADPANRDARALAAQAFEQLGYLAESATWRNAYLLGAQELRTGPGSPRRSPGVSPEMLKVMPLDLVFDHLGTRLNGPRAGTARMVVNWRLPDTGEAAASTLSHGALTVVMGKESKDGDAMLTIRRSVLETVILGQRTMAEVMQRGDATVSGNSDRVIQLFELFDDFDAAFPIVEPRR